MSFSRTTGKFRRCLRWCELTGQDEDLRSEVGVLVWAASEEDRYPPIQVLDRPWTATGRRTVVGGSYARTGVPQAASSASYNVNNQLTNWKGATLTYDANGNLTSDGTNTYTWNARNQLVSISGSVNASFQYDPFGRRVSKTIGGTTQFLYDGANPVQEISGSSASANLLTGGIDEYFQRTDSAGARSFLTDALGSTLALADSTGTVQTSYTFEPFGNTSTTGASTTNSFAFTGRELDPTGLYFYRARYYNPQVGRFLSEDPIGFRGGINKYAYTGNNPISFRDSSGLQEATGYPGHIGCNSYGIGCHSLNDPADIAAAEAAEAAKSAMAGRKSFFDRAKNLTRCAASVSQAGSLTSLFGAPKLLGSNTFGDLAGAILGPEPGTDPAAGFGERVDQGLEAGAEGALAVGVHVAEHIGTGWDLVNIADTGLLTFTPETLGSLALAGSEVTLGSLAAAVELGKLGLDALVFGESLIVCGLY